MARARAEVPAAAPAEQPKSAQAILTAAIDKRRTAAGEETTAQETARIDRDMREAGARFGPKLAGSPSVPAQGAPRRVLTVDRFEQASFRRNVWDAIVPHGTKFEDLTDPRYWTNVGSQLRQWDRIEVRCEDGSYYGELIVEDRGNRYAKVAVLAYLPLQVADEEGPALPQGYSIVYKGPHTKWVVVRDGEPLREQNSSHAAALTWLNEHLKAIGR